MKKYLLMALFSIGVISVTKAEEPKVLFNFGSFRAYVPFTEIRAVSLFDFVNKETLVGGETAFGGWKSVEFTAGAVTSLQGEGAPYLGGNLIFGNPLEKYIPIEGLNPGIFTGYDFNTGTWLYGVKISKSL